MKKRSKSARPFRRTSVPDLAGKGATDTIQRAELVALVATLTRKQEETVADAHHRISSMVDYHGRRTGTLASTEEGRFQLGDVASWLARQFPGHQFGLPRHPADNELTLPLLTTDGFIRPSARSLDEADSIIHSLARDKNLLEAEVEDLKPDAMKWRAWNAKKRTRATR
ncbi:MAG TPA: hypothetical protein VKV24_10755 [Casimicrobiaceae bacterium]|nr:hypothetical protein [Casimicrobiaceae bacterium]